MYNLNMKQVTFIDQANIKVKAGRGGDGKMGFHKEKYVEHGGPSGGKEEMVVLYFWLQQ